MKNTVKEITNIDLDGLTIQEAIDFLKGYLALDNAEIYYDYYGYNGEYNVTVKNFRKETDKEYELRKKAEEAKAEVLRKKQLKEYERLKKLLGKEEKE